MIYRVEITEIDHIGGQSIPQGNHTIMEMQYDKNEDNNLIGYIESNLDTWDEDAARETEATRNQERLAVILGAMNTIGAGIESPHPDEIEWEKEGDKATYNIKVDGIRAMVSVVLR